MSMLRSRSSALTPMTLLRGGVGADARVVRRAGPAAPAAPAADAAVAPEPGRGPARGRSANDQPLAHPRLRGLALPGSAC